MSVLLSWDICLFSRQHNTSFFFSVCALTLIFLGWLRDKGRRHLAFLEAAREKLTFFPLLLSSLTNPCVSIQGEGCGELSNGTGIFSEIGLA